MSRGGARFTSDELNQVLSCYDIGEVLQMEPLSAGNRRAPKMVIITDKGKFLLKRRPHGKDDLYRVAVAHTLQLRLYKMGFPVTTLINIKNKDNTIVQLNSHIYELFKFISGVRYNGTIEETIDAGRQLASFHICLEDFNKELMKSLQKSFHDSIAVRRQLKTIFSGKNIRFSKKMKFIADRLTVLYNDSSIRVNEQGFDVWPVQVIHGDWHPGNMLFKNGSINAVLDFDSIKAAPRAADLANGMLQFSIIGDRPNPLDWPDYLDQAKLIQFLDGYREKIDLDKGELDSLIDLMIETIVAEAVLPVAATGFFGNFNGEDFLRMIEKKATWLSNNRELLTEAIGA